MKRTMKYDSIIHKSINRRYQLINRVNDELFILTDNTNMKWRSEVNICKNEKPLEARPGCGNFQKMKIQGKFTHDINSNYIIL